MSQFHRLKPGQKIRLADLPTGASKFHNDRAKAELQFEQLRAEFIDLQYDLYAEGRRKLMIVLQAMDAGGKDGTIRHIFKGVNPQGVRVSSFKAPSAEELAHDYLRRIHREVPAAGMIAVFNRSQYEDVLVVRVEQLVPEPVWKMRFRQINEFERHLSETGTTILKFFLHISKDEQRQRFQERLDDPKKQWKFAVDDLTKRTKWREYMGAYDDVLEQCTTEHSPWYVIPSDQKWYRNVAIAEIIVETLRTMDLQRPSPPKNIDELRIE